MPELRIENLRKSFDSAVALSDVSLTALDGELLTLLGPSGCGKSTTLWSVAGLHTPDSGTITIGGRTLFDGGRTDVAPERRGCGVVFQSYAVWPHMTVADNVGYPLKLRRVKPAARRARVREVLELVELEQYSGRYPHELSGGQQQRVALARALAHPPEVLLLDEPFSNLDAKLRERARDWLRQLQRSVGVTTVFVTHDQDEALSMSDRIVVMSAGRVRQIGTPEDVYDRPADMFVADFVGTVNKLPARIVGGDRELAEVHVPGVDQPLRVANPGGHGGEVVLTVRPECLVLHEKDNAPAGANVVVAPVVDRSYLGDHYRYRLRIGHTTVVVQSQHRTNGSELLVEIPAHGAQIFPAPDAAAAAADRNEPQEYAHVS